MKYTGENVEVSIWFLDRSRIASHFVFRTKLLVLSLHSITPVIPERLGRGVLCSTPKLVMIKYHVIRGELIAIK